MASQKKIIEMIGAVKTIYPYYAKDMTDNMVKTLVRTWETLLKDYDDAVMEAAFFQCLQSCKMPPTPADVIEQIRSMHKALAPSDEELWTVYIKALRSTNAEVARFGHTYVDSSGLSRGQQARQNVERIWDGLPDKIKGYLGSKGELMRNAQAWGNGSDFDQYEKPRFLKAMPIMEKRQAYSGLMLEGGKAKFLLEGE